MYGLQNLGGNLVNSKVYKLYVDMATRNKSDNKSATISLADMGTGAIVKQLATIASACGYNVTDMTFGWTIDLKQEMTMIIDYNIKVSNPMYWHPKFTFVLQRNKGTISCYFVLYKISFLCNPNKLTQYKSPINTQ